MPDGVRLEGAEALVKKIVTLKQLRELQGALKAAAAHIRTQLMRYPTQQRGRPQPFVSDRQRRYFFWALREGKIDVPYRRGQSPGSQNLKQRWSITAEGPAAVALVNNTKYGPYVQGAGTQTRYHQAGGWPTVGQVLEQEGPRVAELLRAELERIANE